MPSSETVDELFNPSFIVDENSHQAANLTEIQVQGAEGFTDGFLKSALSPLLKSADCTVSDLVTSAHKCISYLQGTDCFDDVKFFIDKDSNAEDLSSKSALAIEPPINMKAILALSPKQLSSWHVGSYHDARYGHIVSLDHTCKNLLGSGKYLNFGGFFSNLIDQNGEGIRMTLKLPMADSRKRIVANILAHHDSVEAFQSKHQVSADAELGIEKHTTGSVDNKTFYGVSLVRRSIMDVADSANDEVKTYAGDNYKESLIFRMLTNNLVYLPSSHGAFPLRGFETSVNAEYTGFLPPNPNLGAEKSVQDQFQKAEVGIRTYESAFNDNLTLACQLNCGAIRNLSADNTVHFQDKFYVPIDGYRTLGLGKSSPTIGGLSYFSYKVALYTRLLFAPKDGPLRAYASLSGAKLCQNLKDLSSPETENATMRSTASLGMVYNVGDYASLNLGYNFPLTVTDVESTRPGVALGMSLFCDF